MTITPLTLLMPCALLTFHPFFGHSFFLFAAKLEESKDPNTLEALSGYFKTIEEMSVNKSLPARARFMIQDLLELRANKFAIEEFVFPCDLTNFNFQVEIATRAVWTIDA